MHVVGVTGKDQQKSPARLDRQLLSREEDFAAVEFIIEITDRRYVAVRGMIGHPIALFVLPTIVRMPTMVPSRTYCGQDHRLRIERRCEPRLIAYIAQAFFDETRNNLNGIPRIAELRPIDDGKSCLIPNLCQMDVSIVHRHQPAAIFGTNRISDLNYHL